MRIAGRAHGLARRRNIPGWRAAHAATPAATRVAVPVPSADSGILPRPRRASARGHHPDGIRAHPFASAKVSIASGD